jgi:hypothetical protein
VISVFCAKDLKPFITIFFMWVMNWKKNLSYIKIISLKEFFLLRFFCFD